MIVRSKFQNLFRTGLLVAAITFGLVSCEKDITVDLDDPEIKLVVEGYIQPGGPAYVFISRTDAFFAPVDSISLLNATEKNALVLVSDGTVTDTLLDPVPGIGYFLHITQHYW